MDQGAGIGARQQTYTPDLFIANRARHAGLIIDVKRSLASYAESKLEGLRFRMLAVAAIASSWLGARQGPVLAEVGTAIIRWRRCVQRS